MKIPLKMKNRTGKSSGTKTKTGLESLQKIKMQNKTGKYFQETKSTKWN